MRKISLQDAIDAWVSLGQGNRNNGLMSLAWTCYNNGYSNVNDLTDKLLDIWCSNFSDGGDRKVLIDCSNAAMKVVSQAELKPSESVRVPRKSERQIQATAMAHEKYRREWIEKLMLSNSAEITKQFEQDELSVYDGTEITDQMCADLEQKRMDCVRKLAQLDDGESIFLGTVGMQKNQQAYLDMTYTPQIVESDIWCPNPLAEKHCTKANLKKVRYLSAEIDEAMYEPLITAGAGTRERYCQMRREQIVFWNAVKDRLPIACMTSSGRKSVHVLFRVDTTVDEIERMRERLVQIYACLHIDRAGCTPSQATRTPWGVRFMVEAKDHTLLKREDVVQWVRNRNASDASVRHEAMAKLKSYGLDVGHIDDKIRYVVQNCIYIDAGVKAMTLPQLITALEGIEQMYVPQVDNLAVMAKTDGRKIKYLSLDLFRDFLAVNDGEKQPQRIWLDEITRAVKCDGFRTDNINNVVNCVQDMWHKYFCVDDVPSKDKIQMHVEELAYINRTNPVTDWLETLQWDGKDRIFEAVRLLGIEHDTFGSVLLHKWLLQCVAMAYNDAEQPIGADGVLTLYGKQGVGKTSFFKNLVPARHSDEWWQGGMSLDTTNKDDIAKILKCWIGELGELDETMKKEQASLKALVTEGKDSIRLPYDRHPSGFRRHSSLCATVNKPDFLKDTTGNRRWWTIRIDERMNFEKLKAFDVEQLWAQIYKEYSDSTDKGGCFRLTAEEQDMLNVRNLSYTKMPEIVDVVMEKYDISKIEGGRGSGVWSSLIDIARDLLHDGDVNGRLEKGELSRVSDALKTIGLDPVRRKSGMGYFMPPKWGNGVERSEANGEYDDLVNELLKQDGKQEGARCKDPLFDDAPKEVAGAEGMNAEDGGHSEKVKAWVEGLRMNGYRILDESGDVVEYERDGNTYQQEYGIFVEVPTRRTDEMPF